MKNTARLLLMMVVTLALQGCSTVAEMTIKAPFVLVDGIIEGESDHRAEKEYIKQGTTPKEAKQRVFEDEFFKDAGGRP